MEGESATGILAVDTPILVVDDSIQFATILSKLLKGIFGYTDITLAHTVENAISLLSDSPQRAKVLFVDYRFPNGHTGLELLEWLYKNDKMQLTTAFLITSEPTPDIVSKVRGYGGNGVIAKPVDRSELKTLLKKAEALRKADAIEYF